MSVTAEREELIRQHLKVKKELDDIRAEIDRLEKANEYLRRQNQNMRQMLESRNPGHPAASASTPTMGHPITRQKSRPILPSFTLPNTDFIMDTLSQATSLGDVATGDIFKQAMNMADDFAKRLQLYDDDNKGPDYDSFLQNLAASSRNHSETLSCDESVVASPVDTSASAE